jgi:type IV secretory pathway protease TraF
MLSRETRRILLLWPAWLGALMLGLLLYGTTAGGLLLGAAVALHAWILCDAAAVHDAFAGRPVRFAIVLAVFGALLLGIYGGARHAVAAFVKGMYTTVGFPAEQIHSGDFLLVNLCAYGSDTPRRGDIILYCTRSELFGPAAAELGYAVVRGETMGRILAIPGEDVVWKDGQIQIYGRQKLLYAVGSPAEFASLDLTLHVPPGQYFCLPPAVAAALGPSASSVVGAEAKAAYVRMMGFAALPDIRGRAFMVYEPLSQRRWLPRSLLP